MRILRGNPYFISAAIIGFVLATTGCDRSPLLLEMATDQTDVTLRVTNYTGGGLMVGSEILGTAKLSDGDLYLVVTSEDGEVLPLCGMITTHVQSEPVLLSRDQSVSFREDLATIASVYCLGDRSRIRVAVEYREVGGSVPASAYRSNSVALNLR